MSGRIGNNNPVRLTRGVKQSAVSPGDTRVQRPFAAMQATMSAIFNRPGVSG